MNTIGIFTNIDKDKDFIYTKEVYNAIRNNGLKALLPLEIKSYINDSDAVFVDYDEFVNSTDIIMSIGGDGTFLKAARMTYKKGTPLLGVNLGTLGFLTDIEKNEIDKAVNYIAQGNYIIEDRIMVDAKILRQNEVIAKDTALNDVVISYGAKLKMLHALLYINDEFVDRYPCDGLIISTPTGSTAYSLSAGGPIVEPDMNVFIITPISAHLLYTRSFIADTDKIIRVKIDENDSYRAMVTIDGQYGYELMGGDEIIINKSPHSVKLIKMKSKNFFNILRKKIYYRGEDMVRDEV